MKKILLLCSIMLLVNTASFSQDKSTYRETLKKMMKVAGSEATYKAAINQMVTMFKQQKPEVPAEVWNKFGEEFTKAASDDLLNILLPVYQKHLTEEDLKQIIVFYQSPAGSKLAEKTPFITQESMQAGQEWGQRISQEFLEKLQEKGY